MKIPKVLKLPRKLKKELKKGFTRNIRNSGLQGAANPLSFPVNQFSMYQTVSYSGSNNKSFRRLCKFARKEEKRLYQNIINDAIKKQFDWLVDDVSDINTLTIDRLKQFQRKMFYEPIQKPTIGNIPELWKEAQRYIICFDPAIQNKDTSTVHVCAHDDIITASCIGLYCDDQKK